MKTIQGFKNFLMQGNVIIAAIGLAIALAFSTLVKAFTDNIITPLVNAAGGGGTSGLGFHVKGQLIDIGAFISAIIYFAIFMAVVYFLIVVPYRAYEARLGNTVFGPAAPTQTCPECLSGDLPAKATRCKYCTADLRGAPARPAA
jgi:large conductance mechanosensitive channel